MLNPGQKVGRSEERNLLVPSQTGTKQVVKPDKMIQVGVRNENVSEFKDLTGRKGADIS